MTKAITTLTRMYTTNTSLVTIPALKKISKNPNTKTVVHIGRLNSNEHPICLCSQQEKDDRRGITTNTHTDWVDAKVDDYPSITCKSCLRILNTLTNINYINPETVAHHLGIKVEQMATYIKPHYSGPSGCTTTSTPEPEPFARMLPGGSRIVIDAIALMGYQYSSSPVVIHSAVCNDKAPNGIPLCEVKSLVNGQPDCTAYTKVDYKEHPSITCPECAKLQRERRLEEEPKRDKSLAMRKSMINAEEQRVNKMGEYISSLIAAVYYLKLVKLPLPYRAHELPALRKEYRIACDNLTLMKQCIISVR